MLILGYIDVLMGTSMEDDLQSAGLSRERVALFVGPRCLLRP